VVTNKKNLLHVNVSTYAFNYKCYKCQPYDYFIQLHPDVNDIIIRHLD